MSHPPMGILQIRNKTNGKVYVDSSSNVPGRINRIRFQLNANSHPSKRLQADWNELGEGGFEFETLENVEPREDQNTTMRQIWKLSKTFGLKSSNHTEIAVTTR